MSRNTHKATGAILAIASSLSLGMAGASQVTATYDGVSPKVKTYVETTLGKGYVTGGLFKFKKTTGAPINTYVDKIEDGNRFVSFCIDLADGASSTTWDLVELKNAPDADTRIGGGNQKPMGATKAAHLAELYGSALQGVGGTLNDARKLDNNQLRALQLATWEVVYETKMSNYDIERGNAKFWRPSKKAHSKSEWKDIKKHTSQFLAAIDGTGPKMSGLMALTNGKKQDYVVQAVPLPAAAWFFGSALLGAGFVSRRRKKQLAA